MTTATATVSAAMDGAEADGVPCLPLCCSVIFAFSAFHDFKKKSVLEI